MSGGLPGMSPYAQLSGLSSASPCIRWPEMRSMVTPKCKEVWKIEIQCSWKERKTSSFAREHCHSAWWGSVEFLPWFGVHYSLNQLLLIARGLTPHIKRVKYENMS